MADKRPYRYSLFLLDLYRVIVLLCQVYVRVFVFPSVRVSLFKPANLHEQRTTLSTYHTLTPTAVHWWCNIAAVLLPPFLDGLVVLPQPTLYD